MICIENVKTYCKDYTQIENYDIAVNSSGRYECHHRLETHNSDGERRLVLISRQELIALDMYWDRPPEELIFLTCSEHRSLHNKDKKCPYFSELNRSRKGVRLSEKHKAKLSAACKGWKHSEAARAKISAKLKGNTIVKGMHWFHNDEIAVLAYTCPEGFIPGRKLGSLSGKAERKAYKEAYSNKLCLYKGETLKLHTLVSRFCKQGIAHPSSEARKYLIE